MATLLNARRSPTVRLLSGIGSSMSFCQRTEPQKTMTEKTKRTGRLLCQPVYFLMVPKGRLDKYIIMAFLFDKIFLIFFHTNGHTNKFG